MRIKATKIDQEQFKKFGLLVDEPHKEPTSQAENYKFWSDIANYHIEGETEIGICKVFRQPVNIIDGVERHLRTPEILIPIDDAFVISLLLEGEDESQAQAFLVDIGQAIVIDPSVWHGACIPTSKNSCSYFVIFKRKTPYEDVEMKDIQPIEVVI